MPSASSPHHPVTSRPAPFASVRRRLVAWNIGVLCAILLVVAVSVAVIQSRSVVSQVDTQLRSQAQRVLLDGRLGEDLSEAQAGLTTTPPSTPPTPAADETTDPYEASESPNVFSLLLDANGHVLRATQDVQALGLPDMAAVWPVLTGTAQSTLVTLDQPVANHSDGHFRLYTVPVRQNGHIVGVLQVGTSLAPRNAQLRDFLVLLALAGGAGVVLAAAGGLFLAQRALVPVQTAFERQRIFVADASHELRTPLSLMRAEAELLMRGLESRARAVVAGTAATAAHATTSAAYETTIAARREAPPDSLADGESTPAEVGEWAEMARDLVAEVDYMSHLIDDLLQLARMDSGAEHLHREIVDVAALIEATCRSAQPAAAQHGLRLSYQYGQAPEQQTRPGAHPDASAAAASLDSAPSPSSTGGVSPNGASSPSSAVAGSPDSAPSPSSTSGGGLWVWADPDRLRQIVLILLDNALRYTPSSGAIQVVCWRDRTTPAPAGSIVLEVRDTGPGIAPEHLSRLFDRFYRVDKARSREMGGAGLGLAIADGLARVQGGTLSVESKLGAGTTFRLTLPASPEP